MIRWAVHRPMVVAAAAMVILIAGGISFSRLSLVTRTEIEYPRLSISASWGRVSSELVEMYITSTIESAVQGVRGVARTSSTSSEGQSNVTVTLQADADVQLARLAILERLETLRADGAFPDPTIRPSVTNYVPDAMREPPLLMFNVSGPYTPGALQQTLNDLVIPRLAAVPGVGSVFVASGIRLGIAVVYDPRLLRQLRIRPDVLSQALANSRVVLSLGDETLGASVRHVVLRDEPRAVEDLLALPIVNEQKRIFRLGDLARITPDEDTNGRFSRINGQPAVILTVSREATADAINTARAVHAALAATMPTLPPGIRFMIVRDESVTLAARLRDLETRTAISCAAVLLVLLATIRTVRATALVMTSAAVAIAGTALSLYVLHIPANLLTLAGLGMGVGVLVQDAIIVVDRMARVPDTPAARANAAKAVVPAIMGATLTTLVVLIPFLYLQGDARAAFVPFAAAFGLAVVWAAGAAVILVPALGRGHGAVPRQWRWGYRAYAFVVRRFVMFRWAALLIASFGIGWLSWHFYKTVPRSSWSNYGASTSYISVGITFPRGSNSDYVDAAIHEFENISVGRPGVSLVTAVGNAMSASLRVDFAEDAETAAVPMVVYENMVARAALIGGASISVYGYGNAFSSGSSGMGGGGRIRVTGYSYDGVVQLADDIRKRLEAIPRVTDVRILSSSYQGGNDRTRVVTLMPDRERMARYGISAAEFASAVQREVNGGTGAQRLTIGGQEVLVALKGEGARERTLDEIRESLIPVVSGAPVRLGDVATVGEQESMMSIDRDDQQYVRTVGYDFRGPAKLAQRTHRAFMQSISLPVGYGASDDVFTRRNDESSKGLWLVFAAGIILVLLAVATVFDSVWAAWAVLMSLPVAFAGVLAAFIIMGAAFTREAAVGVILVVGLAVHQGILLVDGALARRRKNLAFFGHAGLRPQDAVRAAMDRAGMISIITLSTLASVVPLIVNTRTSDLFGAIALATAGGTVGGTLSAMLLMPALLALGIWRMTSSERSRQ